MPTNVKKPNTPNKTVAPSTPKYGSLTEQLLAEENANKPAAPVNPPAAAPAVAPSGNVKKPSAPSVPSKPKYNSLTEELLAGENKKTSTAPTIPNSTTPAAVKPTAPAAAKAPTPAVNPVSKKDAMKILFPNQNLIPKDALTSPYQTISKPQKPQQKKPQQQNPDIDIKKIMNGVGNVQALIGAKKSSKQDLPLPQSKQVISKPVKNAPTNQGDRFSDNIRDDIPVVSPVLKTAANALQKVTDTAGNVIGHIPVVGKFMQRVDANVGHDIGQGDAPVNLPNTKNGIANTVADFIGQNLINAGASMKGIDSNVLGGFDRGAGNVSDRIVSNVIKNQKAANVASDILKAGLHGSNFMGASKVAEQLSGNSPFDPAGTLKAYAEGLPIGMAFGAGGKLVGGIAGTLAKSIANRTMVKIPQEPMQDRSLTTDQLNKPQQEQIGSLKNENMTIVKMLQNEDGSVDVHYLDGKNQDGGLRIDKEGRAFQIPAERFKQLANPYDDIKENEAAATESEPINAPIDEPISPVNAINNPISASKIASRVLKPMDIYTKAIEEYNTAIDAIHNHFGTDQLTPEEMARVKVELGIDLNKLVKNIEVAETGIKSSTEYPIKSNTYNQMTNDLQYTAGAKEKPDVNLTNDIPLKVNKVPMLEDTKAPETKQSDNAYMSDPQKRQVNLLKQREGDKLVIDKITQNEDGSIDVRYLNAKNEYGKIRIARNGKTYKMDAKENNIAAKDVKDQVAETATDNIMNNKATEEVNNTTQEASKIVSEEPKPKEEVSPKEKATVANEEPTATNTATIEENKTTPKTRQRKTSRKEVPSDGNQGESNNSTGQRSEDMRQKLETESGNSSETTDKKDAEQSTEYTKKRDASFEKNNKRVEELTGKKVHAEIIEAPTKQHKALQEMMRKIFNISVEYYKSDSDFEREFVDPQNTGTIFIKHDFKDGNAKVGDITNAAWSVGHGFLHTLKVNHPDLYNELYKKFKDDITDDQINEYMSTFGNGNLANTMTREKVLEEIFGDELGNNFTTKEFWNKVYNKSKPLYERLKEVVKTVLDKINKMSVDNSLKDDQIKQMQKQLVKIVRTISEREEQRVSIPDKVIENGAVSPTDDVRFSVRTWNDETKSKLLDEIVKKGIASKEKALKYFKDIDNVAAIVLADADRLDYEPSELYSALKSNADPHYKESLDFSTLCKKRYALQGTISKIQLALGRGLTQDEFLKVRKELNDKGIAVSCGACYVDTRRLEYGIRANQYIEDNIGKGEWYSKTNKKPFPDKVPPKELFFTQEGLDKMKKEYPDIYTDFNSKTGARGMKAQESRTEYRSEILKMAKTRISALNSRAGLRWQSWSDFEPPHLIDAMQAIADMYAKALKSHAYTKVKEFAQLMGKTGMKINMSLIPKGKGLDAKGNLLFDPVEGMDFEVAKELRNKYDKTHGTIAIGISDDHIKALLKSNDIDYVIPYHASGLSAVRRQSLGIGMEHWNDYTNYQSEKVIDKAKFENGGSKVPSIYDFWDYSKTPQENAAKYVKLCEDNGLSPQFEHLKNEPNYWKLLIDYRMLDKNGNYAKQMPVKPEFDMKIVRKILSEYNTNHRELPFDKETVGKLSEEFKNNNWRDAIAEGKPQKKGAIKQGSEEISYSARNAKEREKSPIFYSNLEKTIEDKMPNAAPVDMVKRLISSNGVKQDEIKWSGIDDFLRDKTGKVSKQEVMDFIKSNRLDLKEVTKHGLNEDTVITKAAGIVEKDLKKKGLLTNRINNILDDIDANPTDENYKELWNEVWDVDPFNDIEKVRNEIRSSMPDDTKYSDFTTTKGKNYKEMLFTLPYNENLSFDEWAKDTFGDLSKLDEEQLRLAKSQYNRQLSYGNAKRSEDSLYKSSHWKEPNVLAHTRFSDMKDSTGKKVLFVHEIQSDWHQQGRKTGYGDRVKEAPLSKTWHEYVLKRLIRHAAENGYDKVAISTGEQNAKIYDLSKSITNIKYSKNPDGTYHWLALDNNGNIPIEQKSATLEDIEKYIGKDFTEKIKNDNGSKHASSPWTVLQGNDLKMGGEGMKGFYDKMIPDYLNKYLKKWGGKVETSKINGETQPTVIITPEMKDSVLHEGQPLYSARNIKPRTDKWDRGEDYSSIKEKFPNLFEGVPSDGAEKRHPTQITGTVATYNKIYDHLQNEGFKGSILDASSGMGYGTQAGLRRGLNVDDVEPFPDKSYKPKYTNYNDLKKKYDVIISNAVLNVVPQDLRDGIVDSMAEHLKPNGRMFINVRGTDVLSSKGKQPINDKWMEYFIPNKNSYQKGFKRDELVSYLQDVLGDGYKVEAANKNNVGYVPSSPFAVVTKLDNADTNFSARNMKLRVNDKEDDPAIGETRQRGFIKSVLGTKAIPDILKNTAKDETDKKTSGTTYTPINATEEDIKAQKDIEDKFDAYRKDIGNKQVLESSMDTARAIAIYQKYIEDGNFNAAREWQNKIAKMATRGGQAIQALNRIKKFDAEWTINRLEKEVKSSIPEGKAKSLDDITFEIKNAMNKVNRESVDKVLEYIKSLGIDYSARNRVPRGQVTEKEIINKVKAELKASNINLADLVKQHYSAVESVGQTIKEKLMSQGMNQADAAAMEKMISDAFNKITAEKKQQLINNIFRERNVSRRRPTVNEKIIQWSNLGIFDDAKYSDLVAQKLKLPYVSDDLRNIIRAEVEKIQKLPDGSEEKAVATAMLTKKMRETFPVGIGQKLSTLQTMAQLLNPKTTFRNLISNTAFAAQEGVKQIIDTPLDILGSLGGKARTRTLPKPITYFKGFGKGLKTGVRDAWLGIDTTGNTTQMGLPRGRSFKRRPLRSLETGLNIALRATDTAFKRATYEESIAQQMKLNKINAKRGKATLVSEPTIEMQDYAKALGDYRTFNDDSNLAVAMTGLKQSLNKIGIKDFGLGDLIIKYPKVPANIISRGIDYSPASILKVAYHLWRGISNKENVKGQIVDDISRGIIGSAEVIGVGVMFHKLGIIVSDPDPDKDKRELESEMGLGQYRINTSALKRWVLSGFHSDAIGYKKGDYIRSYDWFQPFSIGIALGSSIDANNGMSFDQYNKWNSILTDMQTALTSSVETVADQSLFSGITTALQQKDAKSGLSKIGTNAVTSFIPSILNQLRQYTDNTVRNTTGNGFIDSTKKAAMNRIPNLSKKLEPSLDVWGNEKKLHDSSGIRKVYDTFASPSNGAKYSPTKETDKAFALYEATGRKEQFPKMAANSFDKTTDKKKDTFTLSSKEKADYQRELGRLNKNLYDYFKDAPNNDTTIDEYKKWFDHYNAAITDKIAIKKLQQPKERIMYKNRPVILSKPEQAVYKRNIDSNTKLIDDTILQNYGKDNIDSVEALKAKREYYQQLHQTIIDFIMKSRK